MTIIGTHAIIFAENADTTRAFMRDVLGLDSVDAGGGWLIFKLPPAELGVHPIEPTETNRHELYLMCDDIERTMDELRAKGATFTGEIVNAGFGRVATMQVPGGGELALYQPRHPTAIG